MTAPPAFVSKFLVPKQGYERESCEDAYVVWPDSRVDEGITDRIVAALCDGASESLLAGHWARQLAAHCVREIRQLPETLGTARSAADTVMAAVEAWEQWVALYVAGRESDGRPLAWYEQPGLARGAHATLLALSLELAPDRRRGRDGDHDDLTVVLDLVRPESSRGWRWRAVALGDTCLFHIHDDRLERAFPVRTAADFGIDPALVTTGTTDTKLLGSRMAVVGGRCASGDQLYLATDALAAWFLRSYEAGARPWDELRQYAAQRPEEFEDFITRRRADGTMRNDDVALIHIDIA